MYISTINAWCTMHYTHTHTHTHSTLHYTHYTTIHKHKSCSYQTDCIENDREGPPAWLSYIQNEAEIDATIERYNRETKGKPVRAPETRGCHGDSAAQKMPDPDRASLSQSAQSD